MMKKLSVTKERAIQVLSDRLKELNQFNMQVPFNAKAWKDKTVNDLKEIFQFGQQWLQVSGIQFDTFVTTEKSKVLEQGKQHARELLISYIDWVKAYEPEKDTIWENMPELRQLNDSYKIKFDQLLKEWNETIPQYNQLMEDHLTLTEESNTKDDEIAYLKGNTLQLDNMSLKKVFKAMGNLPLPQIGAIIGFFLAVAGAGFWIGSTIKENSTNTTIFNLNKELSDERAESKAKDDTITNLQQELHKLKSDATKRK